MNDTTQTTEAIVVGALGTNCWIVPLADPSIPLHDGKDGKKPCAVIDPGEDAPAILSRLERRGLYPRYILLTHGHFDHIAALPEVAAAFGGAAEVAIHRDDAAYLGAGAYQRHRRVFSGESGAYLDSLWKDMPEPARLLAEGDTIGPFQVLHLPGHTPGSAGFYDQAGGRLFSGDTLFRAGVGRTDLSGGDEAALQRSLLRLFALDGNVAVYPGHGPATTIGRER